MWKKSLAIMFQMGRIIVGKNTSWIITSGAVRPYEPWEAVTGSCHALSVAVAVVRALGDRICKCRGSSGLLIAHQVVTLKEILNSSIYPLKAAQFKRRSKMTEIFFFSPA